MSYIADPDDNTKQIPRGLQQTAFSRAETPAASTVVKNPSYVIINRSGSYAFAYQVTASLGTVIGSSTSGSSMYVTGSVSETLRSPVRLDINPGAWRRTDAAGAVGDVTFVYRGQ